MKPQILVFVAHYLPGYKAGGPVRTIANVVDQLGAEFDFKILTLDRDMGDEAPYAGIPLGSWSKVGAAQVYYLRPSERSFMGMRRILAATDAQLWYLNSFFSPTFTIQPLLLRRLGLVPRCPIVLAPRGEFAPSALAIRSQKKASYLALAKATGLLKDVLWQASTELEEADIRKHWGSQIAVAIANNPSGRGGQSGESSSGKQAGSLDAIFLSRISPMKNLTAALDILADVRGPVRFHIYGNVDDAKYWARCLEQIQGLPTNVEVDYLGSLPHAKVSEALAAHDVLFLPTLGENFGHVIQESLLASTPVLISDRTPWRGLRERSAGWDLPLESPDAFRQALQELIDMDATAHQALRVGARALGCSAAENSGAAQENSRMFERALRALPR